MPGTSSTILPRERANELGKPQNKAEQRANFEKTRGAGRRLVGTMMVFMAQPTALAKRRIFEESRPLQGLNFRRGTSKNRGAHG